MSRIFLSGILVFSICAIAPASAQNVSPIADVVQYGTQNLKAVDQAGNLFSTYPPDPDGASWSLEDNIPSSAGRPALSSFVGLGWWYLNDTNGFAPSAHCAITESGEFYWYQNTVEGWQFHSVVPENAGRPAESPFIDVIYHAGLFAMTNKGERYRFVGNLASGGNWEFVDSIEEEAGVIEVKAATSGSIKSLFR
jgi:hypothetical protein